MRELDLTEGPVTFEGAVSLERTGDGVRPWRLLHERVGLYPDGVVEKASAPAGVRLTTVSDTESLELGLAGPERASDPAVVDLAVDGELHESRTAGPEPLRFEGLPAGSHCLELYLPQAVSVTVTRLGVDADARAHRLDDARPRWVTYGSSITQCRRAHGPARTWPALAARLGGRHLTCLGYAGECHLDAMAARTIGTLRADAISLKLGVNVHGQASFSPRSFAQSVLGFILTVRDAHPDVPLLVLSPVYATTRERQENAVGMTIERMRHEIADVVERLRGRGDRGLHYRSGLELLGPGEDEQLADAVHPHGDGYELMGRRFADLAFGPEGPLR